jgi:hypothetical protein
VIAIKGTPAKAYVVPRALTDKQQQWGMLTTTGFLATEGTPAMGASKGKHLKGRQQQQTYQDQQQ